MGPDEYSSAEVRAKQIAAMQTLIDEGRAGGISPYTVKEISSALVKTRASGDFCQIERPDRTAR
jgi:hypothetical protein